MRAKRNHRPAHLAAAMFAGALAVAPALAGEVPQSYGEAMAWYSEAAAAGDPQAQFLLAWSLETGARGATDAEGARSWYAAAAAGGHPRAQLRLAIMLMEGKGGPPDVAAARRWLTPAAEAGERDAMSLLGLLLASEEPIDRDAARRWLSLAATGGDATAAANLAALDARMAAGQQATAVPATEDE